MTDCMYYPVGLIPMLLFQGATEDKSTQPFVEFQLPASCSQPVLRYLVARAVVLQVCPHQQHQETFLEMQIIGAHLRLQRQKLGGGGGGVISILKSPLLNLEQAQAPKRATGLDSHKRS